MNLWFPGLWFSKRNLTAELPAAIESWREIARTTLACRDSYGFHLDGAEEAMAGAGYEAIQHGKSIDQAIDDVEAAYNRHFVYSTPHEHPCDEWAVRAIREAA